MTLYLTLRIILFGCLILILAKALLGVTNRRFMLMEEKFLTSFKNLPASVKNRYAVLCLIGLFSIFSFITFTSLFKNSATMDEAHKTHYGLKILEKRDTLRADDEFDAMPVNILHAIPLYISRQLGWGDFVVHGHSGLVRNLLFPSEDFPIWMAGRMATVVLSLLLGAYIFRWSRALYGVGGALLSLAVFVFCPNMLAHGILTTTDMPVTSLSLISLYYFWRFLKAPGVASFIKSSVTVGLAQIMKYTAVHLLPICLLVYVAFKWKGRREKRHQRSLRARRFLFVVFLYVGVVVTVIHFGFLFQRTGRPLESYLFKSASLQALQSELWGWSVRVPLPQAFVTGIDQCNYYSKPPHYYSTNFYLLGEIQNTPDRKGWWHYFLMAFLLKMPTATLVLISMCFWLWVWRGFRLSEGELFLLIPATYFFLNFSLFLHSQPGFRYILPMLPFLYIWLGQLVHSNRVRPFCVSVLCVWLVVSTLSFYPYFVPYFNESIGYRKNAYLYLSDTNLQWNQGWAFKKKWLAEHPGVIENPEGISTGLLLVDTDFVTGVWDPPRFRWLRENYKPVDHVAYEYLLYRIPPGESENNDRSP